MSELISGLIAGLLTLFITPIFNKNNNDQNSLNTQSDWREKLSELSYSESISLKELMKFRSCLSAVRGFSVKNDDKNPLIDLGSERLDLRFKESKMALDDTCLQYYDYILSHESFCFMYDEYGKWNKLDKSHADVIRFLCLLLLKSDWNNKIDKNKFFSFLGYKETYEPAELKGIYIVTKSIESDLVKHNDNPNTSDKYIRRPYYLEKIENTNDYLYVNYYKQALCIISKNNCSHFHKSNITSNIKSSNKDKKNTIILCFIALFLVPLTSLLLIPINNYIYIYFFVLYFVFYFIFTLFAIIKNIEFKNSSYYMFIFDLLLLVFSSLCTLYLFLTYNKEINLFINSKKQTILFLPHSETIIIFLFIGFFVLIINLVVFSIIIQFLKHHSK